MTKWIIIIKNCLNNDLSNWENITFGSHKGYLYGKYNQYTKIAIITYNSYDTAESDNISMNVTSAIFSYGALSGDQGYLMVDNNSNTINIAVTKQYQVGMLVFIIK